MCSVRHGQNSNYLMMIFFLVQRTVFSSEYKIIWYLSLIYSILSRRRRKLIVILDVCVQGALEFYYHYKRSEEEKVRASKKKKSPKAKPILKSKCAFLLCVDAYYPVVHQPSSASICALTTKSTTKDIFQLGSVFGFIFLLARAKLLNRPLCFH